MEEGREKGEKNNRSRPGLRDVKMGRARERKRGKRADKIQARKNKQIHLVRPRQVGRCVQEPQRGLLVLQRRRIRAGCKCASLSLSLLSSSLSRACTHAHRESRVRAGVSALMKHVHRWQLSRRRHDNGRPNVKGRSASAGWLLYSAPFPSGCIQQPKLRLLSGVS